MSNTYFQCKQFIIHQETSAMKVCTDGCLFGAWVADKVAGFGLQVSGILDIGAGTGLLSLMSAQKCTAKIDAVEMDEAAAEQAAGNFELSKWKERLQVIQGDVRTVHLGKKYDLIISNPPFLGNDLKSRDTQRNLALHSSELSLPELLAVVKKYLAENGRFAVLLPYHRKDEFISLSLANGFYTVEEISVKQTPAHSCFRVMLLFGTDKLSPQLNSITIREGEQYSEAFIHLLKDYYLKL